MASATVIMSVAKALRNYSNIGFNLKYNNNITIKISYNQIFRFIIL